MSEVYRKYKKGIEVSNMGNVKKDGVLLEKHSGEVYDFVCFDGKQERIHILVASCFPDICGKMFLYCHVHHINRNQRDNRAENLTCISASEHKKIHQKEDGVSVPVKAYDLEGNYVGRWDSKGQAAEATPADYRHISEIIEGKVRRFTAGGLFWFKEEVPEEEVQEIIAPSIIVLKKKMEKKKEKERRMTEAQEKREAKRVRVEEKKTEKLEAKKIVEFNISNEEVKVWNNPKECAEFYHTTIATIKNNIAGRTLYTFIINEGRKEKRYFRPYISCH